MTGRSLKTSLWALAILMLALSALSLRQAVSAERRAAELTTRSIRSTLDIAEISIETSKLRRFEKEFILYVDDAQRRAQYYADWKEAFEEARKQIAESIGRGEAVWGREELARLSEWGQALTDYGSSFSALAGDVERGAVRGSAAANAALDAAKKRIAVVVDGTEKQGVDKDMQLTAEANALVADLGLLKWSSAGFGALGLVLVTMLVSARQRE